MTDDLRHQSPLDLTLTQNGVSLTLPEIVEVAIEVAADQLIHIIADQVVSETDADVQDVAVASAGSVEPASDRMELEVDLQDLMQAEVDSQQTVMVATLNLSPRKTGEVTDTSMDDLRWHLDGLKNPDEWPQVTHRRSKRNGVPPQKFCCSES